jgi:hypothetical protein
MDRIYHTWEKWECYPAGFYGNQPPLGLTRDEAEIAYRDFLSDIPLFEEAMKRVITEWINSCEHYLTNERMNRIAWMGQSAMCIFSGVSSKFRGGYNLLSESQQLAADTAALEYINVWFIQHGFPEMTMEEIQSRTKANLY